MKLKRLISAIMSVIIVLSSCGNCLIANAQTDADKQGEQCISTEDTDFFPDYEMTVGEVLDSTIEMTYSAEKFYLFKIEDNEIAGYGIDGQDTNWYGLFLRNIVAKKVGETTYNVIDVSDDSIVATRKIKVNPVKSVDIKLSDPEIKVDSVNGVAEGIVSIKTTDDILYHYIDDKLLKIDNIVKGSHICSTKSGGYNEYIWYNDGILTLNGVNVFEDGVLVTDFTFDEQTNCLYVVTNEGTLWRSSFYDKNPELKAINKDCDRFAGHRMYYRKDGMLCRDESGYEIGRINMVDFSSGIDQQGDCLEIRGEIILDDEGKVWRLNANGNNEEEKSPYTLTLVSDEVSKIGKMVFGDMGKLCVYIKTDGKIYSFMTGKEITEKAKIFTEEFEYHNMGLLYNRFISYPNLKATLFDDKTANVKYINDGIKITDVEDVFGCQTAALILRSDGTLWRYAGGDTVSQVNFDPSQNNDKSFVYGDVNGDRSVDLLDFLQISMYLLGDVEFNQNQIKAVDFNENGAVDISELATVRQYIMKDNITLGPKK